MKKPVNPNPSKVIIIPQTPQNNREEVAPQENAPMETQAPVSTPTTAPQQAKAEVAEEEDE